MDCLFCYKMYVKEIEYKDIPLPNPELCANAISKLLQIPLNHPDVQRIFEEEPATPLICGRCHDKLVEADKAMKALAEMEELQRRVDSVRIEIRKDLDHSKDVSEVMAKLPDHLMSKASLGRLAILKAIGTGSKEPAKLDVQSNVNDHAHHEISETFQEEQVEQFQDPRTSQIDQMDNDAVQGPSGPLSLTGPIIQKKQIVLKRLQIPRKRKTAKLEPESIIEESESEVETPKKKATQGMFQCRVCSKILSRKDTLKSHEALHTGQFPFKCQHCSRGFLEMNRLRAHLGNKTSTKCTTCNETFKSQGCLKQHDWKVHGKGDYAKVRGSVLKNYTRLADGRFKCNRCPKIIASNITRANLRSHKLVHEPPSYLCNVEGCGKEFKQLQSLKTHKLSIHEGIRYPCQVAGCGRIYVRKGDLLKHAKIHSQNDKANSKKMGSTNPHMKSQQNHKDIPSLLKKKKRGPWFKCRVSRGMCQEKFKFRTIRDIHEHKCSKKNQK